MELSNYKFRGARASVLLHEYHLPSFYNTWKEAKEAGIKLPKTNNPDYELMHTLLVHILKWALDARGIHKIHVLLAIVLYYSCIIYSFCEFPKYYR
jgi:hypothetical protein